MIVKEVRESKNPEKDLAMLLNELHKVGPDGPSVLEKLSYFKEFYPNIFVEFEEKIISALGIFYKIKNPNNLYSLLMSGFGVEHVNKYGSTLTPVQASIRRAVDEHQYTSISAPTSAGKSYSIRDLIGEGKGDAVIVVPSRALIAEYMNTMRRKFVDDKNVMISSFVDHVYTSRVLRRIFILTPERSKDLYKIKDQLNIEIFFFDEAQISDEKNRGIIFDVMVRRVKQHFPYSKMIFAHPFVDNPDAQFSKHGIGSESSYSQSYTHGSVGKICVFEHNNSKSYYFSPYVSGGHRLNKCVEFDGSFRNFALNGNHSILIYVSKNSIYRGDFTNDFDSYISDLPRVSDINGLKIIENIEHMLGADNLAHQSKMIELLKKGVVIHHGSIPLEARFLIENFIRDRHSALCFATSTLAQGINMPFDIVWLDNNRFSGDEGERALAFKNLIGRSGRLSKENKFDFGYVYTSNSKLFADRVNSTYKLKPTSLIESHECNDGDDDRNELIDSIQNNTFDDDKNIPLSKVERLSRKAVLSYASKFLDIIYRNPESIKLSIGGKTNKQQRTTASKYLKLIYEASLGRQLYKGESAVFDSAILIFFHMAQGRSFREIVGIRYSYISDRDKKNKGYARFSQPAGKLPDSSLRTCYSIFSERTLSGDVGYDAIVFDTYDYMDQVISFSLSDVFVAVFQIYNEHRADDRANRIIELFRYGTNNSEHILLMRYGFPPETVVEVAKYVEDIDEARVVFKSNIDEASNIIRDLINWYLP